jgi:hypothetical protein
MRRLLRFWALSRREKQLCCEAAVLLLLSYLSVRTVSFSRIDRFLRARWDNEAEAPSDAAGVVKLVDRSLSRVLNLLPWKNLCLSRSIAEFVMLRRRGIPAVMVAGVKVLEDCSLHAHAWIDAGHAEPKVSSDNRAFTPVVRIGQGPSITGAAGEPF